MPAFGGGYGFSLADVEGMEIGRRRWFVERLKAHRDAEAKATKGK